jgi:hypothetical protein
MYNLEEVQQYNQYSLIERTLEELIEGRAVGTPLFSYPR